MKKYLKVNEKTYDTVASEYVNKYTENETVVKLHNKLIEIISSRLKKKHLPKVLEIGPGIGELLKKLEEKGYKTIGVDLSKNMSEISLKNSPNSIIINSDINKIKFLPKQFDLILALAVIHNFPPRELNILLINIKDWLKDDGFLIIDTTYHEKSTRGYYRKEDFPGKLLRYRQQWKREDLDKILLKNGFKIDHDFNAAFYEKNEQWLEYVLIKNDIK